jgi:hypothetical protein
MTTTIRGLSEDARTGPGWAPFLFVVGSRATNLFD